MGGNMSVLALHASYRACLLCLYTTPVSWYIVLYVHLAEWTLVQQRVPALSYCYCRWSRDFCLYVRTLWWIQAWVEGHAGWLQVAARPWRSKRIPLCSHRAKLNFRSGLVQWDLSLGFLFHNCLWKQLMARMWLATADLPLVSGQLVPHGYPSPYYYDESKTCNLCISDAKLLQRWHVPW